MKESTGRLLGARQLSRQAALGFAMAAAVVAGFTACHGSSTDNCHYLAQATGVLGQTSFITNNANAGGVGAASLGGDVTSITSNNNNLSYVADTSNNRILGFASVPIALVDPAATFEIGQGTDSTDFKDTTPGAFNSAAGLIQFRAPENVSVDPSGQYLVVADSVNNRVLIWNSLPTGNVPPDVVVGQPDFVSNAANNGTNSAVGSNGSNALTCANFASTATYTPPPAVNNTTGNPSQCNLNLPTAAYVANGNLVVVDKQNNRVMIWNPVPTTNGATANYVLGQNPTCPEALSLIASNPAATSSTLAGQELIASYSFTCNSPGIDTYSGSTYALEMNSPSDVWTDGIVMLVSDTGNHRVLAWPEIPTSINALPEGIIGQSQFGSTSLNGASGTQGLHSPFGVTSDGTNVFVADSGNNRVLEYTDYHVNLTLGPAAQAVFGQADFTHITDNDPDQNSVPGDQRNNPTTNGVTAGTMNDPLGVYANQSLNAGQGVLYVTDTDNNRILQYPILNALTPTGLEGVNGSDTQDSDFCF
jgi:hypothetical protein